MIPLVVLAAAAVVVVLMLRSGPGAAEHQLVTSYVRAWAAGDYRQMYSLLSPASQQTMSERRFTAAYRRDATTATTVKLIPQRVGKRRGEFIPVSMLVGTRLFGTLHETLEVPLEGSGSNATVQFVPSLLFPGLAGHERLTRHMSLAPRATLFAADGTPLAQGADRTSPIADVAGQIAGVLEPIPSADAVTYAAQGYPPDAKVGEDGLERAFQTQLAGTPGGVLRAGHRVLARVAAKPGHDVTTTIVPDIERAAIAALAGRYGGIAAMNPRTGALLALAGVAFSALQPPGSTMKIITTTGALEAGIVKLSTTFPIATSANLEGYILHNAGGEACGGTLLNAFAVSCNSVFAPLGAKLGGKRLVDVAERFGFNQQPTIPGAAEPTIPSASAIGGDLAVGSSAIGQGKVQASVLEMTDVAATIAMGGRRPLPTLQAHLPPRFVHVTSRHVAGLLQKLMIAVVQFGTGVSAAIPGVTVAGKTGTAELQNTATTTGANVPNSNQLTDAWFVGYAPVGAPRIVAGALFPNQGAGGATAAPAVREVLITGLEATH
ncbi:MAG TPA: penicillin-binding transpeptidase domain-containing protein [Solirubrobacteraceae bacterium]|nr:penicillin-binding transpeptidase domain-containing protein [Solirubrobacteraceae bacterium]